MLPYTRSHGIGFMAYGTLGFDLLTRAFNESTTFVDLDWRSKGYAFGLKQLRVVDRLRPIAARHGTSVAQLAISWVLGNPAVTVALVGIRRTEELQENVAAVEWRLSPTSARKSTPSSPKRASPRTSKPPRPSSRSCRPADRGHARRTPRARRASVPGEHHLAGAAGGGQVERLLRLRQREAVGDQVGEAQAGAVHEPDQLIVVGLREHVGAHQTALAEHRPQVAFFAVPPQPT